MTTAIKTGGSSTTTVLKALQFNPSVQVPAVGGTGWITDLAQMNAYINQAGTTDTGYGSTTIFPLPQCVNGILYMPSGRGQIKMVPGDWLYVDPGTGWPLVIPASVVAGGHFVHS